MTQQVRKGYRNHRKGTWAAVLAVLVAAAMAIVLPASGAADKKVVSASISPSGSWARGSTVSGATITITNSSDSQQLGSADLCIPNALAGVAGAVATPVDSPCTGYSTSVLRLRSLAIAPGTPMSQALGSIAVSCTAPATLEWRLYAKQSNDFSGLPGNNFTPYPFPINVSVTGACTLSFVTQPSQTANAVDPSTSPLTSFPLKAEDGTSSIQVMATTTGGTPTLVQGVPVTINSSAITTSGGGTTSTNAFGIASFPGLRVGPDGGEYTVTASAPGFTSATSNGFFVFSQTCTSAPCTTSKQIATDTNVSVTQSGFTGPIGILVDTNGSGAANACTGGSTVGDDFRIEIRPMVGNTEITWRFTKDKRLKDPNNGQTYELCVGSKFTPGYTGNVDPAFPVQPAYDPASGLFPAGDGKANDDGSGRFWGVLTDAAPSTKCNASYSYPYPTKVAEYSNGADAIQVACFPYPFDPKGIGVG